MLPYKYTAQLFLPVENFDLIQDDGEPSGWHKMFSSAKNIRLYKSTIYVEYEFETDTEPDGVFHLSCGKIDLPEVQNYQACTISFFLELASISFTHLAFTIPLDNISKVPTFFEECSMEISQVFDMSKTRVFHTIDYSSMIDFLAAKNLVTTSTSTNVLALDDKCFTLDKETYDVDCLGTSLCLDISKLVQEKYLEAISN